jgi:hypothetical protein
VQYEKMSSMSEDYNTNEYLFTNEERIFGGNALELMVALYKSEQLPVRVRLYAAAKAVEFESDKSGRTLEELKEEVRQEFTGGTDYQEEILARLERIRAATPLSERVHQQVVEETDDPELADAVAALIAAKGFGREAHITEIALPAPKPVVPRVRRPPEIDAEEAAPLRRQEGSSEKSVDSLACQGDVAAKSAPCPQAGHKPAPEAAASNSQPGGLFDNPENEPAEPEVMTVTRRPGGGIRYIPLKR